MKMDPKLLKCTDCDFSTFKVSLMRKHKQSVHPDLAPKPKNKRKAATKHVEEPEEKKVDDKMNNTSVLVLSQEFQDLSHTHTSTQSLEEETESENLLETEEYEDEIDYNQTQADEIPSEQEDPIPPMKTEPAENGESMKDENVELKRVIERLQKKVREVGEEAAKKDEKMSKMIRQKENEKVKLQADLGKAVANHTKEISKLLDENKKMNDEIVKLKRELREKQKKGEARSEKPDPRPKVETFAEKSKKSGIRCKYSDNEEGCMRQRCDFHHPLPSEHCKKWLNGGGCLMRMCKFRHVEAERRRLIARKNERKRERTETSPISRVTRQRLERNIDDRKRSNRGEERSHSRRDRDFRQGAQQHGRKYGQPAVPRDRRRSR